jgi:hypothetical protein
VPGVTSLNRPTNVVVSAMQSDPLTWFGACPETWAM